MNQLPSETYYQFPPPGYYPLPPQEEREIHLRDYLKVILKKRWVILAIFLIAVTVGALKNFTTKPVYRGTATIQINIENPQIVDFKEIFTVNMWAMDYYQTQYRILESRNLAKRVVHDLKLWEHPGFLPQPQSPFQEWKSNLFGSLSKVRSTAADLVFGRRNPSSGDSKKSSSDPSSEDPSEDERETPFVNQVLGGLRIEPIKDSRLIKVHFDSYYPDLAGQVPNALAAAYIQHNLESRVNTTEQARDWLRKQLEEMKAKVEKADEALQEFGAKHDILSIDEKENITTKRLNELNDALAKAESERMDKEALYKQMKQDRGQALDTLPSILENKLIQDLKQNYAQLEAQYLRLSETFKPGYPEMIRIKNQMGAIQRRIYSEVNKYVAGIKNEYESALRKETLLRKAFEDQKTRAIEMQQKAIQYNILKREAETNKELYKSLLLRMKEISVSAGMNASNIQMVDKAEVPRGPYKPDTRRNLMMAAVIGLFLGVAMAFVLEHLDNTIKTPDDVEQILRLPSFGVVPEISHEKGRGVLERKDAYPVELITFRHPRSILSEAYRGIRTAILLSSSGRPPKTIVVSSPSPFEGKTTTMINTAIALSQIGAQVIIIDADMRKPRVHRVFDGGNGTGLSTFLSGNAKLGSVIKRTNIPNLYYISSGPIPPNPSELLGSNLFKTMLQLLGEKFDQIIIDSPPILGFTDSVVLSASVDGVVLVVSGGKTPKETLRHTKDTLHQVNAKILGVVINRVNIERYDYKDYYSRYQYYQNYYVKEGTKRELPYRIDRKNLSV
jgi:succinoglycan biosynthesis transport protein ExoP